MLPVDGPGYSICIRNFPMNLRTFYCPELGVAITGGTGFLGSRLISSFSSSASNHAHFVRVELTDVPPETKLVHCAASISAGPSCAVENIQIDHFVFENCLSKNLKLIYCSGNNVYPLEKNCQVGGKLWAKDYYALSKITGEYLFQSDTRLRLIILRIGDVFGKGQRHGNMFKAVESAIQARTSLKLYGEGAKIRNYIHIDELSHLIAFLVEKLVDHTEEPIILNGVVHEPASVRQILEYVANKMRLEISQVLTSGCDSDPDIRTMVPFSHPSYARRFETFWDSLDHYMATCTGSMEKC